MSSSMQISRITRIPIAGAKMLRFPAIELRRRRTAREMLEAHDTLDNAITELESRTEAPWVGATRDDVCFNLLLAFFERGQRVGLRATKEPLVVVERLCAGIVLDPLRQSRILSMTSSNVEGTIAPGIFRMLVQDYSMRFTSPCREQDVGWDSRLASDLACMCPKLLNFYFTHCEPDVDCDRHKRVEIAFSVLLSILSPLSLLGPHKRNYRSCCFDNRKKKQRRWPRYERVGVGRWR